MSFGFVYFLYLLKFLLSVNGRNDEICENLALVSVVFRHGDRAPESSYPNDPYGDASHWPNGWGQLTRLGKQQQYGLGKWMRHRYWDFLPIRYNASDIYVRSTDVDRTLMSAYCYLAGLYECWSEEDGDGLAWQPIPVHTIPVKVDHVLAGRKKCPLYEKLLQDLWKSEEVSQTQESYREVFRNLSNHSGLRIDSVSDCVILYSTLNIQNLHGFCPPEWAKEFFPHPLKEIAEYAFRLPCYTASLKRLKCGPLLGDIIQHMQEKKEGRISQKMWVYSGHDTTLVNLMQCLEVFDGTIPSYTATLILELHRETDGYYVSIFYKTPTTLRTLKLPSCDEFCPFEDFKRIYRPVVPVDWERECMRECTHR